MNSDVMYDVIGSVAILGRVLGFTEPVSTRFVLFVLTTFRMGLNVQKYV